MRTDIQQTSSFPYLSIDTDDYKTSLFDLSVNKGVKDDSVCFSVTYSIENDEINKLISDKKLSVVLLMSCSTLGIKKAEKLLFDSKSANFIIDKMDVDDRVEFIAYLVANENFEYSNSDLSKNWKEKSYFIEKGNKIGESTSVKINLEHKKTGKKTSIFHFTEKEDLNELDPVYYTKEDDSINFIMPKGVFKFFYAIQSSDYRVVLAAFIIPTLTDILRQMQSSEDFNSRYKDKKWYEVIKNKFERKFHSDPTTPDYEPYRYAQLLVDSPFYELLRTTKIKKNEE